MLNSSSVTFKISRSLSSLRKLASTGNGVDWNKQEKIAMEPFEYVNKMACKPHKMVAPIFNHWLQVPKEKFEVIEEAMQALGTWSLLLDDIQDNSAYRYGVPAAHRVFGVALTLNAASLTLLKVVKKIGELGHPLASTTFINRLREFHIGHGGELYFRHNILFASEETYMEIAKKSNGSFAMLPVELLQLFSSDKRDYSKLVMNIAQFFTVVDDYYNLFDSKALQRMTIKEKIENSGDYITCSDITECKITLPIVHALQFPDVATELADILKQRTSDPKLQIHFISLLKKHGSDEYTRHTLRRLEDDIRAEIKKLGGNPILTKCIDDLSY